jgi:hypothetical protein
MEIKMKRISKTLLLLTITGLSSTAIAQQEGSNPNPFNDTPIREQGAERDSNVDNRRVQNRRTPEREIIDRERENRERTARSGSQMMKDEVENMTDRTGLPNPVLPELGEIPLPTTVEDLYRGAEDFRVKGTINGANVEYSQTNNVYRIIGESTTEDLPKPLTVKKNDKGYELATGGKESLPTQLQQEEKGEE